MSALPYKISLSHALNGAGAPSASHYAEALQAAEIAQSSYVNAAQPLELFINVAGKDDLAAAGAIAKTWADNSSAVFVLGIGGSSLGGQALQNLVPFGAKRSPRILFFDNPDPFVFAEALASADLKTTRFLAISKSGGTAETLMQVLASVDALRKAGGEKYLKHHFAVITEPKPSPLRKFAEGMGCSTLDHPLGIGGRYSVLSVVGMLPAILMGLDAAAIRDGAKVVLAGAREGSLGDSGPAAGAALHFALSRAGALRETILWPYSDRLKTFGGWWRQLWAESLGKSGQGTTPVAALGPVDQHSQLQLFLDGPGQALFTVMALETKNIGPVVPLADAERLGVKYLGGRHLGDLVDAEARATAETLARRGRPVRLIQIDKPSERAVGALFMHFMLETMVMGKLMQVDPFDQPAVEEGKVLARTYLDESRR